MKANNNTVFQIFSFLCHKCKKTYTLCVLIYYILAINCAFGCNSEYTNWFQTINFPPLNTPKFKAVVFLIFIHYNFWHFLFEYMKQGTNILLKLLLKSIDQTLAFRMSRVWKDCGRKAWRNKLHLIYNWMGIGASAIYLLFHSLRISNTEGSQLCNGSRCIFEAFFQFYEIN